MATKSEQGSPDGPKGAGVRDLFDRKADALLLNYRLLERILPHPTHAGSIHSGEDGRFAESLLRGFLNDHLPEQIRARSGFIVRPSTKSDAEGRGRLERQNDQNSGQIDIVVYDVGRFPVFLESEELVVVPPEGVVGIVSVKKALRKADLEHEVRALADYGRLCDIPSVRGPHLGLFAFTSDLSPDTISAETIRVLGEIGQDHLFSHLINEVTVLEGCMLFKERPAGSNDEASYRLLGPGLGVGYAPHVGLLRMIQSIMSVYYDKTRANAKRPAFASFQKKQFNAAPRAGRVTVSTKS